MCATSEPSPLRVALFPPAPAEPDAYLTLLKQSLSELEIDVVDSDRLTAGWVREAASTVNVIHLHWLEYLAPPDRRRWSGWTRSLRRALVLDHTLQLARREGIRIVWTIHNLHPHEPVHPRLERWLARRALTRADVAIVHSEYARARVADEYGNAGKLRVVAHGNYSGVRADPTVSRDAYRRGLGLSPQAFVYLAFGQIRAYKQLPELIRAFSTLEGSDNYLIIAGAVVDDNLAAELKALADGRDDIKLDFRKVPLGDVVALHGASDAAVLAYQQMFSSGAALLGLSLGLPIVVPEASTGSELGSTPAVESVGPDGIGAALQRVATGSRAVRRAAALETAARYPWSEVSRLTVELYEEVCQLTHPRSLRRPTPLPDAGPPPYTATD